MIFKDIHVYPSLIEHPREMTSRFRYATRPLCNFLERNVLTGLKFQTEFRRLCVVGTGTPSDDVVVNTSNVATAEVPFDLGDYEGRRTSAERHEFYIDMLLKGIEKCAAHFPTPSDALLGGIEDFRGGEYRNEWTHAAKTIRSAGVKAELRCAMTEDEFLLTLVVIRDHTLVMEEAILRTPPDELLFQHKFKGLMVSDETLIVTTKNGPPLWTCDLSNLD